VRGALGGTFRARASTTAATSGSEKGDEGEPEDEVEDVKRVDEVEDEVEDEEPEEVLEEVEDVEDIDDSPRATVMYLLKSTSQLSRSAGVSSTTIIVSPKHLMNRSVCSCLGPGWGLTVMLTSLRVFLARNRFRPVRRAVNSKSLKRKK